MRFLIHILFILLLLGNSLGLSTASGQCLDNLRRYHFKSVEVKKLSVGDSLPVICRQGDSMSFPSDYVASDRAIAVFAQAPKSKYAFDVYNTKYAESLLFSEKYEELRTNGSEAYQVPFKLIPVGATDVVQVTITPAELTEGLEMKAINPDKIIFRTATGAEYKPKPVSDDKGKVTMELTLPAAKENDGYELYALHPVYAANTNGYEYDMLGKLTVVSYTMEKPKVVLVAVNGNTIDENAVKTYLDKVYLPVGVNWQVGNTVEFVYDIPKDSLDVTGSGLFSRYTPAMKRMNAAFMQRDDYDASTLYIFVLQRASLDNTSGDMPRGCQFGYIFTGAITDAAKSGMSKNEIIGRTIAHELGHGMFKLKHTFDSEYRIAESTTDNLMDYNWGTDYVKHQWDAIHAPGLVIGLFEKDEDAMNQIAPDPVCLQKHLENIRTSVCNNVLINLNKHSWPSIGNRANNITLLDGITYKQISVRILSDLHGGKLSSVNQKKSDSYQFGKVVNVDTKDNAEAFYKYLFPSKTEWKQQMDKLVLQIKEADWSRKKELLTILPHNAYPYIDYSDRLEILKKLSQSLMTEDYTSCINEEEIALNLINAFENDHEDDLLKSLEFNELFKTLYSKIQGDNRWKLVQVVAHYVNKNRRPDDAILYNEISEYKLIQEGTYNKEFVIEKHFLKKDVKFNISSKTTGKYILSWPTTTSAIYLPLGIYEYVGLSGNEVERYFDLQEGQSIAVPAIVLNWMLEKQTMEEAFKALRLMIDGVIVIGSGGSAAGANVLVKLWCITNTVMPTIDACFTLADIDKNPDYKEFYETWDKLYITTSAVTGAGVAMLNRIEAVRFINTLNAQKHQIVDVSKRVMVEEVSQKVRGAFHVTDEMLANGAISRINVSLLDEMNGLNYGYKNGNYIQYIRDHLSIIESNKATLWELPFAKRGFAIEGYYSVTKYEKFVDLNQIKSNFPVLDFADKLSVDGSILISMKTYHPEIANRTLSNFENKLKDYLKILDDLELDNVTDILKKQGKNVDLTNGSKALTVVVKEGQWNLNELRAIANKLQKEMPAYMDITIIIETF